jgi:phosphoserine phosphatase
VQIIFVRHGQTDWNAEDRMQGQLDAKLSQLGLRQAAIVSNALAGLRIDAIYSSDLSRAMVTAHAIAEPYGIMIETSELLREVNLGAWQGLTLQEIQERFPSEYAAYRSDAVANRPPGAERIESVIARVSAFLEKVTVDCAQETIVVVAHGGTIRGALCWALDSGPLLYRRIKLANAGITSIEVIAGDTPTVTRVNDTCHLRTSEMAANAQEL